MPNRMMHYFSDIIKPNLQYITASVVTATGTMVGLATLNEILKAVTLLISLAVGLFTLRKLMRDEKQHLKKNEKGGTIA